MIIQQCEANLSIEKTLLMIFIRAKTAKKTQSIG